jgi:triphosphoribosyl-dephospho-CoA synthase CitG
VPAKEYSISDAGASADTFSSAGHKTLEKMWQFLSQAIFLEVSIHPKPGLVTRVNNGSHQDMSILTFAASSAVLCKSFYDLQEMGLSHRGTWPELLAKARRYGAAQELEMLRSTKNINTQKGIHFSGGILSLAAGAMIRDHEEGTTENICAAVRRLTEGLVCDELQNSRPARPLTAGEKLFKKYNITGIRGEVERGFPSVTGKGLPALKEAFLMGADLNDALVHALLALMAVAEDSNVVWRSGYDRLLRVQSSAAEILSAGSIFTQEGREVICRVEREFLRDKISPGGSADLLAVTIALYLLENGEFPVRIF